eukprot:CAMPEP_0198658058 /NCGR_PEP_ID=MMETSP1467-20131203/21984_1 /TAXON_ID=1462469 /ORGANISM="unid. sp., Strain CCMP2135" /LENGTH=71 /DNA_ID=CAMNT_0044394305 /DNA_START=20 /DNA_END=233 /DNA_ORIENTATION=+
MAATSAATWASTPTRSDAAARGDLREPPQQVQNADYLVYTNGDQDVKSTTSSSSIISRNVAAVAKGSAATE